MLDLADVSGVVKIEKQTVFGELHSYSCGWISSCLLARARDKINHQMSKLRHAEYLSWMHTSACTCVLLNKHDSKCWREPLPSIANLAVWTA